MAETEKKALQETPKELRVFHEESGVLMALLQEESPLFRSTLALIKDGQATVELKKRYMLRAIDEEWVNAIEEALPSLDTAIRNPSKYITEREEVLPIEMSKNISPQSLKHLAQHTDMISKIEGDKITPSKLLNVFREETMQTYENKFLNTLISRLLSFVSIRYDVAKNEGKDEKDTTLTYEQAFSHGTVHGKMKFTLEISEPTDENDTVEKNYSKTTDLWKRVERIYDIVNTYAGSEFVKQMGQSYVRPPIMRTNAILKNPNMRRCLALWQFIEGYDTAGYSMLIQEDLENVPEEYVKNLYEMCTVQYLNFRYNVRNEFDTEAVLDEQLTDDAFSPKIVDRLKKITADEFTIIHEEEEELEPARFEPGELELAVGVALRASQLMLSANPEESLAPGDIPEPEPVPEFIDEEVPDEEEEEEIPAETPSEAAAKVKKVKKEADLVGEKLAVRRRRAEARRKKRFQQHQRNRGFAEEAIREKMKAFGETAEVPAPQKKADQE
ncbi:MAG: DUF2357 domain-containing protein [Lachnospiraceae bacterium]|nr:DUF2357 domain-containing protein [Lachnospiraceae bacterium]